MKKIISTETVKNYKSRAVSFLMAGILLFSSGATFADARVVAGNTDASTSLKI